VAHPDSEAPPRFCSRCIARHGTLVNLVVDETPPRRAFRLSLYVANRSDEELAALRRVADELEGGSIKSPDGGGFAIVELSAASEAAAHELVRAAIARAGAVGLVELA
jgi:hypothetical protein